MIIMFFSEIYNLDNDVCDPHPLLIEAPLQPKNALSVPKNIKQKDWFLRWNREIRPAILKCDHHCIYGYSSPSAGDFRQILSPPHRHQSFVTKSQECWWNGDCLYCYNFVHQRYVIKPSHHLPPLNYFVLMTPSKG